MSESTFRFLSLPPELRNMIYGLYCFSPRTPYDLPLLRVWSINKQIKAEVLAEISSVVARFFPANEMQRADFAALTIARPICFAELQHPEITLTLPRVADNHWPTHLKTTVRSFLEAHPSFVRSVDITFEFDATPLRIQRLTKRALRSAQESLSIAVPDVLAAVNEYMKGLPVPVDDCTPFFDDTSLVEAQISWPERYDPAGHCRGGLSRLGWLSRSTWNQMNVYRRASARAIHKLYDKRVTTWTLEETEHDDTIVVAWGEDANFRLPWSAGEERCEQENSRSECTH